MAKTPSANLGFENKLPRHNISTRWHSQKDAIDEWVKQHPEDGMKKKLG